MSEQPQLNHLQRYLAEEAVEDYREGHLSRRDALKMLAGVLGSTLAATSFLAACVPAAPATQAVPAPAGVATAAPATASPAETSISPTGTVVPGNVSTSPAVTPEATASATLAVITTTATASVTPGPTPPLGVRVSPDDPAITAADVQFPGTDTTLIGYLARPKTGGAVPPVLVCHENRGLTDHIKDVTRRLGKAGYAALAVDLLSRQGGIAAVADATSIPGLLGQMSQDQIVSDFQSGLAYLQGQPNIVKDRPGMVGFCFGGGVTWLCATRISALRAAVPFYGPNPPLQDVPKIQAAVLAMYGALDQRIDAGIPAIEQAMQDNQKVFEKVVYPGAAHAFHNDTGPNYNAGAATDAWAKTLAWFDKYLKGES
jgi:carboxymethylenebutenolidase